VSSEHILIYCLSHLMFGDGDSDGEGTTIEETWDQDCPLSG